MEIDLLLQMYPRLFHMAEDGAFPSIQERGLLSATALLDLYEINGARRLEIEAQRRPESVTISKNGLPNAVIRDNKPMTDSALEKCLQDGLRPEQWYRTLNEKTFFWLHKKRLWRLLKAKAYRDYPQTILTVDTASLVASHQNNILLSPINSGSTIMNPQPRGRGTFLPIADYPFGERRKTRAVEDTLVELTVPYGVHDIMDHLISAHRFANGQLIELWRRPGADLDDGPHE
ncbi:hypothetical protein J2Z31_002852 [Sinorhizobium kostiense]|uniref:Uncharacterized protein n=1 Tax=Sinorhizobium kostiense TaxID=76747 RepID=A0ABS4R0D1_9HYPH|nr:MULTISPECIES: hypothetical protein [Sinorhizobium]MBP2236338.1 hypothetical protein [Sinorhizobium kostiense]